MPHGNWDYGSYTPKKTIAGLADMGELAVRLGSPDTFDRRGDVMLVDDFEDNINKWVIGASGVGGGVALSNDYARNGSRCAKITSGDAIGDTTSITRNMPYPVISRIGFEISFTYHAHFNLWGWYVNLYDGVNSHTANIKYADATQLLTYYNSAGADITFATAVDLYAGTALFHTAKLVVDFTTDKYVRFILDDKEYDLSSYAIKVGASANQPLLSAVYAVATGTNENNICYADDAIITQNEP